MTHLLDKATDHEVLQAAIDRAIEDEEEREEWQDLIVLYAVADFYRA